MNTDDWSGGKRVLLVAMFAVAGAMHAAEPAAAVVLRSDAARLEAMRQGDGRALAKIFSDEVVFIHSDGRSEAKADYIKNLTAGDTAYTDLRDGRLEGPADCRGCNRVVRGAGDEEEARANLVGDKVTLHVGVAKRAGHLADGRVAVDETLGQQRRAAEVVGRALAAQRCDARRQPTAARRWASNRSGM